MLSQFNIEGLGVVDRVEDTSDKASDLDLMTSLESYIIPSNRGLGREKETKLKIIRWSEWCHNNEQPNKDGKIFQERNESYRLQTCLCFKVQQKRVLNNASWIDKMLYKLEL